MSQVRVLVLEDDEALRDVLVEVLKQHGYDVHPASNGEEALALARENHFELMVADIRMSGMDGLQALEAVRVEQPQVRSLVVTGFSTEADSIRAIRLGVGDYLKKPFTVEAFMRSVGRLVAERLREKEMASRESALRRTAIWALESVVGSIELTQPTPGLSVVQRGRLAASVMGDLAQPEWAGLDVQAAVLLAGIEQAGSSPPGFVLDGLSPESVRLSQEVLGRLDATASSLSFQVAHVCLAAQDGQVSPDLRPALEPVVLAAVEKAMGCGSSSGSKEPPQRRSLLWVARTLEHSGDSESAAMAYQDVISQTGFRAERVEGHLGLARLCLGSGDRPGAEREAREAVRLAEGLGPVAAAWTRLEAAGILAGCCPDGAAALAAAAAAWFGQARIAVGWARARLLEMFLAGEPTPGEFEQIGGVLFSPDTLHELSGSLPWLLPWLLDLQGRGPTPLMERAVRMLALQFPHHVTSLILGGRLTPPARLAAASVLRGASGPWVEHVLATLSRDEDEAVRKLASAPLGEAGAPSLPVLRLYSFEEFEVFRGDLKVDDRTWKSQKVRYLLAFLACHRGRVVSDDVLIETFWPDDPVKGKLNLYSAASYLKGHLRPPEWTGEVNYVVRLQGGLQLNPAIPRWHDVEEFDTLYQQARDHRSRGRIDRAVEDFRRMVRLYRGPYLAGCYMDWASFPRDRAERQAVEGLTFLAETFAQRNLPAEAREYALRLLEIDSCHQTAHQIVMASYLSSGRPEEAVRHFEACRRTLRDELGVEPSVELLKLYQSAQLGLSGQAVG
ncbi:MAG: response regulator [Candidatus Eremiobacterota bacterium]